MGDTSITIPLGAAIGVLATRPPGHKRKRELEAEFAPGAPVQRLGTDETGKVIATRMNWGAFEVGVEWGGNPQDTQWMPTHLVVPLDRQRHMFAAAPKDERAAMDRFRPGTRVIFRGAPNGARGVVKGVRYTKPQPPTCSRLKNDRTCLDRDEADLLCAPCWDRLMGDVGRCFGRPKPTVLVRVRWEGRYEPMEEELPAEKLEPVERQRSIFAASLPKNLREAMAEFRPGVQVEDKLDDRRGVGVVQKAEVRSPRAEAVAVTVRWPDGRVLTLPSLELRALPGQRAMFAAVPKDKREVLGRFKPGTLVRPLPSLGYDILSWGEVVRVAGQDSPEPRVIVRWLDPYGDGWLPGESDWSVFELEPVERQKGLFASGEKRLWRRGDRVEHDLSQVGGGTLAGTVERDQKPGPTDTLVWVLWDSGEASWAWAGHIRPEGQLAMFAMFAASEEGAWPGDAAGFRKGDRVRWMDRAGGLGTVKDVRHRSKDGRDVVVAWDGGPTAPVQPSLLWRAEPQRRMFAAPQKGDRVRWKWDPRVTGTVERIRHRSKDGRDAVVAWDDKESNLATTVSPDALVPIGQERMFASSLLARRAGHDPRWRAGEDVRFVGDLALRGVIEGVKWRKDPARGWVPMVTVRWDRGHRSVVGPTQLVHVRKQRPLEFEFGVQAAPGSTSFDPQPSLRFGAGHDDPFRATVRRGDRVSPHPALGAAGLSLSRADYRGVVQVGKDWVGTVERVGWHDYGAGRSPVVRVKWDEGPETVSSDWQLGPPRDQAELKFGRVKTAIALPDLVRQTNAFSRKYRPGCAPTLQDSNPKALFLHYNVRCNKEDSDPAGHDVRVQFDVTKVEETQKSSDLDVQVQCSCPAFLYWGAQWNLHQRDGLLGPPRPKLQAPTERLDLRGNYVICKHIHAVFERILPAVQHNIVKILREREVERRKERTRALPKKLEDRQREMRLRQRKEKIRRTKDRDVREKMLEALRSEEEARLLHEQQLENQGARPEGDEVGRDRPATEPGAGEEPLHAPEPEPEPEPEPAAEDEEQAAIEGLTEDEEKSIEEAHEEGRPHLHKGLPYEAEDEEGEDRVIRKFESLRSRFAEGDRVSYGEILGTVRRVLHGSSAARRGLPGDRFFYDVAWDEPAVDDAHADRRRELTWFAETNGPFNERWLEPAQESLGFGDEKSAAERPRPRFRPGDRVADSEDGGVVGTVREAFRAKRPSSVCFAYRVEWDGDRAPGGGLPGGWGTWDEQYLVPAQESLGLTAGAGEDLVPQPKPAFAPGDRVTDRWQMGGTVVSRRFKSRVGEPLWRYTVRFDPTLGEPDGYEDEMLGEDLRPAQAALFASGEGAP